MASLVERIEREGSVPLEAYGHQVGGHHFLVKFKNETICKPLNAREQHFYETIPPELRVFTPEYHGVITVALERQTSPSGEFNIVGYPRKTTPSSPSSVPALSCSRHQSILGGEDCITSKASGGETYINPWSSQCKKVTKEKLQVLGDETNSINMDYVVLENLTSKFLAPSVLDLKVGTRQHGDNVPIEKVKKHTETCANSTSSTLGVRICGMQKYDAARNEYIFRDKYYGRNLSEDGFREELKSFLHNGVRFRADLLANIIVTLEELVKVVERQDSYRFFSSSLLIIYDGAEGPEGGQGTHMTNGVATPPDPHSLRHKNGTTPLDKEDNDYLPPPKQNGLQEMRKSVDIRMIDFGHSTPTGYQDEVQYTGPDTGYLLGLHSMIEAFSLMLKSES